MNSKTKTIIVRVLAIVLAALMALGVCLQIVFASELDDETNIENGENTVVVRLKNVPDGFPHVEIKALLANVETYKAQPLSFTQNSDWSTTIQVSDGYYFVYANDYAWKGTNGKAYVINENKPFNFYVGSEFDSEKYEGQTFVTLQNQGNVEITFSTKNADDAAETVEPNVNVLWEMQNLIYPLKYIYDTEAFKQAILDSEWLAEMNKKSDSDDPDEGSLADDGNEINTTGSSLIDQVDPDQQSTSPIVVENDQKSTKQDDEQTATQEQEEKKKTNPFLGILKKARFALILLAVAAVALVVVRMKNRKKLEEQIEKDLLDDKRVD